MLYARSTSTRVLRNGNFVEAGQWFGISPEEKDDHILRGFEVKEEEDSNEESPKSSSNKIQQKDDPGVKTENKGKTIVKKTGTSKAKAESEE